jgi:tRNA (guanine37-N1)-methyltransferase
VVRLADPPLGYTIPAMQFDIITIFPEFFSGPLDYGIVRRAREARLVDARVHDLRAFTQDRHRTVDDRPFGGGEGMVLKPEPLFAAVESLRGAGGTESPQTAIVLLSASGKLFRQETARRFAQLDQIILLCGRYEGVDERVAEHLTTDELSIGDFVLSGGELGAALILDAVTRLLPGALGNEDSAVNESFSAAEAAKNLAPQATNHPSLPLRAGESGTILRPLEADSGQASHVLLDFPHYTRPAEFRGWKVPDILLCGNHEEIRRWRLRKALEKTRRNRPDLLGNAGLQFENADASRKG